MYRVSGQTLKNIHKYLVFIRIRIIPYYDPIMIHLNPSFNRCNTAHINIFIAKGTILILDVGIILKQTHHSKE